MDYLHRKGFIGNFTLTNKKIILKNLNNGGSKEIFRIASNIFSVGKKDDKLRNGFMNNFMAP